MARPDGRQNNELRPISFEVGFQHHAEGSVLIKSGDTWVLCSASVEEGTPSFVEDPQQGWLTAEYAMLPRSTHTRSRRNGGGRGKEIQRLIGRSLRAAVDMKQLGPRTITVDCDVLRADGGTRTASISGAWLAIALAVKKLKKDGTLSAQANVCAEPMAAISVGVIGGEPRLDLPYEEDSTADVDMNVVMTQSGKLIELQGTAEGNTFSRDELGSLLDLAEKGIKEITKQQLEILG